MRMASVFLLVFFASHFCQSQTFSDVAESLEMDVQFASSGLMGGGCAWFDYNNDGWEDVYITGGHNEDALFRNNGDGSFTNIIFEAGFIDTSDRNTIGVVTGDIDNDGYREVFVTTQNAGFGFNHVENFLFYNNGDGTFEDISESAGLTEAKWALSATFLDANSDGLLDLFVGNYIETSGVILDEFNNPVGFDHECYLDDLYINLGDLTFINATEDFEALNLGCTLALASSDFDRDGDVDLMVANDFGEWVESSKLLRNEAESEYFSDISESSGCDIEIYGMGVAVGDYDEDMDLDYYITNIGPNVLLEQTGPEDFEDTAASQGIVDEMAGDGFAVGWGTFFFDYDNDTYLDLFVANGHIDAVPWLDNDVPQANRLFHGSSSGWFEDAQGEIPENLYKSRGCAYADFNKDGALDFGVMSVHQQFEAANDQFALYQNAGGAGNYVSLDLEGLVCNRDAFGTQVELHADGRSFLREVDGGSSHCSQNSSIVHFGLGDIEEIDSVIVNWPIGPQHVIDTLLVNAHYEILQDTATTPVDTIITSIQGLDGQPQIEFYPVPVRDVLFAELNDAPGRINIDLYDMRGRKIWQVYRGILSETARSFSVPQSVQNGLYICVVTADDGAQIAVKKLQFTRD